MPTKFEAHKVSAAELMRRDVQYRVPRFQRSFSWTDDECSKFVEDLVNVVDGGVGEYFMGSLVFCESPDGYHIVDGQQRIAMFSLLALVVSELYQCSPHPRAPELRNDVRGKFLGSLDRKTFDVIPRLSLNLSDDAFYQRELLNRDPTRPVPQRRPRPRNSNELLSNAFITLRSRVESWLRDRDTMDLEEFLKALERIIVIQIVVGNESDAYLIFETINDRGLELSTADLVKNYLFSRVGERNVNSVQAMWQALNNVVGEFRITQFLRHYWISKYKLVRERYLFDAIKDELGSNPNKILQFLQDLQAEAEIYAAFRMAGHPLWNDYPSAKRNVEALGYFKAEQCYPLLLAAHRCLKRAQFEATVHAVTILSFRYTEICGRGTANLETLYSKVAISIRNGHIKNVPELLRELKTMYPSDPDFGPAFCMKTPSAQVARYILWETERQLGGEILYADDFTLEHVLPKNPPHAPAWPYQQYVPRLGNLTLLPKDMNRKLRNKGVLEKVNEYAKSGLKINEYWKRNQPPKWEGEEIEGRQRWLASLAVKVWSFRT